MISGISRGSVLNRKISSGKYAAIYLANPKKKVENDRLEQEYEKQKEECTFQPNKELRSAEKSKSKPNTNNKKMNVDVFDNDHDNRVIFQMEIKVGNVIDKIIVRKNDTVDDVIGIFIDKHNLS